MNANKQDAGGEVTNPDNVGGLPESDEEKTCKFCGWTGVPFVTQDPYTTDGTVEVCEQCNNAECFL